MFIPVPKTKKSKEIKVVSDRPIKSIVKAVTWRIIGTLDTIFISYLLTGKLTVALSIGSVEVFSKMLLYYLHERAWAHVRWGRMMVVFRRNARRSRKSVNYILPTRLFFGRLRYATNNVQ